MRNGNPSTHRAAVGLVRCAGYEEYAAVRTAVRESFDLFGGIAALVRPGQRVLLKPNLLSALPAEAGVNTHPSVVRAVAEEALEAGGVLSIGDSPAFSRLDDTCAACGLDRVARELGIPIVPFNRPVWVPTRVPHGPARGFKVDRAILDADVVINIPKLKSHGQLGSRRRRTCMDACRAAEGVAHAYMHGDRRFAASLPRSRRPFGRRSTWWMPSSPCTAPGRSVVTSSQSVCSWEAPIPSRWTPSSRN